MKLEELIRQGEDSEDEFNEKEIPTFEMINEMLARSPEELDLFQQMDQEMFEDEDGAGKLE